MKNPFQIRYIQSWLTAAALLCAPKLIAQSTEVTFSVDMGTNIANGSFSPGTQTVEVQGNFNGWASGDTLVQEGASTVYTNTFNAPASSLIEGTEITATSTNNAGQMQYKFVIQPGSTYENTADGNNRSVLILTNTASLVLPTPFFDDDGAPVTSEVTFNVDVQEQPLVGDWPAGGYVEVRGNFNGWSGGIDELTNDIANTNIWYGTFAITNYSPAANLDYKYVIQPGTSWDAPDALDEDGGGNRYFADVSQTLPLVNFSDQSYSTNTCTLTFSVDMSVFIAEDVNFPDAVTLWGNFNGWSAGLACTVNPTNANIYTGSLTFAQGLTLDYQFRYIDDYNSVTIYDNPGGIDGGHANRVLTIPNLSTTNVPTVAFQDAEFDDYLSGPVNVTFTVNMTNATLETLTNYYNNASTGGPFNPSTDGVYVNGQFGPDYPDWYYWSDNSPPGASAPAGFQLFQVGSSLIYTNTIQLSIGTPVWFQYQYGTDPGGANLGPMVDEPPSGSGNYARVIRITGTGNYTLPEDTWGVRYQEPVFCALYPTDADLTVGRATNGTVPVTWLGRPGAQLQSSTNLLGSWQTIPATDGTNWAIGFNSTNGFVSQTNWPANGATFFRMMKH